MRGKEKKTGEMNTNILFNAKAGDWETKCKARPWSYQHSNRVWGGVCRAKITMQMGLRLRARRQDEKVPVMLNTNLQTKPITSVRSDDPFTRALCFMETCCSSGKEQKWRAFGRRTSVRCKVGGLLINLWSNHYFLAKEKNALLGQKPWVAMLD